MTNLANSPIDFPSKSKAKKKVKHKSLTILFGPDKLAMRIQNNTASFVYDARLDPKNFKS